VLRNKNRATISTLQQIKVKKFDDYWGGPGGGEDTEFPHSSPLSSLSPQLLTAL
jgi:hypothetical protein